MFVLLVSIGLSGWVRSRAVGLATTIIAGGAIVALAVFLKTVVKAI